ncbi:MAG: hypothetical protein M3443_10555 [Actinomycetota bacterium]|nr:hypothetical protein [Actinomycetota bacterium]
MSHLDFASAQTQFLDVLDGLVGMRLLELAYRPAEYLHGLITPDLIEHIAAGAGLFVSGDHRPEHRRERSQVLGALVTGLAVCARMPGGVDFHGRHWEAPDPEPVAADGLGRLRDLIAVSPGRQEERLP